MDPPQVGLGDDFAIALGLTLPQHEYARLAAQNGVLKQRSGGDGDVRPNIKRIKAGGGSVRKMIQQNTNFNDVMRESQGRAGEDKCPLR